MTYLEIIPESVEIKRMTDKEYFSDEYKDYISNSKLGLINPDQGGSPELFHQGFQSSFNDSFEIGSAVHGVLLQPDFFKIADIRKPSGKLGLFMEKVFYHRSNGKTIEKSIELASIDADYYKDKLTPKRLKTAIKSSLENYLQRINYIEDPDKETLYLSENNFSKYVNCLDSIDNSPFNSILYPEGIITDPEVYNEYAIFATIKLTGKINKIIKIKGKLDNFTIDHDREIITLNDVKTTSRKADYFMGNYIYDETGKKVWIPGSLEKYHYYRQFGMYMFMLQAALNKPNYKYRCNVLIVETVPDFSTKVCQITNKWIKKGLGEFKKLIILAANEC